jgi:DNA modification methylase
MPGQIELWPIERVIPYERNPRLHSEEEAHQLAAGILSLGFNKPIEVDEVGMILCGHRRRRAAEMLGLKEVPVLQHKHLSDAEKRAYRIADNKLTLQGEWETSLLASEAEEIAAAGLDMTLTGFEQEEMDRIISQWERDQGGDHAPAPEPPANPVTKRGDIWILGRHRLLCGDATDPADMKRLLAGESPRLCVSDPPYGVEYDPEWRDEAAEKGLISYAARRVGRISNDDRADWATVWKLIPSEVLYCWHASLFVIPVQAGIEAAGFVARSQIIWAKPRFAISRGAYHWQHECCLYAVREGSNAGWVGDRSQTTLWEVPLDETVPGGHSAQKPVELMARPIGNHSGDVLDPFVGSGSTLIAAESLNRRCFAMDIDEGYCDVTVQRWEEATGGKAVRQEAS